jgi:hypothetical protein
MSASDLDDLSAAARLIVERAAKQRPRQALDWILPGYGAGFQPVLCPGAQRRARISGQLPTV